MRVAVTGASGLIGTELTKLLDENHIEWVGLSRTAEHAPFRSTDYSVGSLTDIFADVDVVVHLAAIRGRDGKNGYRDYAENEILTENLLKAMEISNPRRIIFLSSISVYSDLTLLPWHEDIRPKPASFYGLSKLTCEYLCESYSRNDIKSVIFRCAHVLGLEDKGYMLSKFLNGAAKHETLTVKGKSVAKREFIYVKDVAQGIVWAIQNSHIDGIYNLGTGVGYTNLEIASTINECFDNIGNIDYIDSVYEGIASSIMDISKLRKAGFSASYSLTDGVNDIKKDKFEVNDGV